MKDVYTVEVLHYGEAFPIASGMRWPQARDFAAALRSLHAHGQWDYRVRREATAEELAAKADF